MAARSGVLAQGSTLAVSGLKLIYTSPDGFVSLVKWCSLSARTGQVPTLFLYYEPAGGATQRKIIDFDPVAGSVDHSPMNVALEPGDRLYVTQVLTSVLDYLVTGSVLRA